MIHMGVKSCKNLTQVLGRVVLSPASAGLSSGKCSSFMSPRPWNLSPQQYVCLDLLAFGGDLVLPGKYLFNLLLSEKGMTSSGHVI